MPSQRHEALLLLFRNRPELAPELLRQALHVELPKYTEARIESAELTDIQPAEYRADLVVLLYKGKPVLGIVVEVQLSIDARKRFAWPMYVVGLRARIKCPVCLLVVSPNDNVAEWAAEPISLGGDNKFSAMVLRSAGVPIIVDPRRAKADPELAVLSAMAHGHDADPEKSLQIATAAMIASVGLDAERSILYYDLVVASLSVAAKKALQSMDPAKYKFQSEFAKRYLSEGEAKGEARGEAKGEARGEAKGKAEGKAEVVLSQLTLKFRKVSAATKKRVQNASLQELDRYAARILSAKTLDEVFKVTAKKR